MYFVCSPSLCGVLVFDSVSRLRLLLRHAPFHSHATLSHTIFHHTIFHTQPCTPSFTHHLCGTCTPSLRQAWHLSTAVLCVAGVAMGDIHLRFAWQAWHLVTSTFVLRGRHGTYGTGLALVARLGALRCAWVRLGALGPAWSPVMPPYFAWQAWHLVTSTFASRGRRGTCHLWHWAGSGVALVHAWARLGTLGRR